MVQLVRATVHWVIQPRITGVETWMGPPTIGSLSNGDFCLQTMIKTLKSRVAEPSHFDGSGSRTPKTGGSGSTILKNTGLNFSVQFSNSN